MAAAARRQPAFPFALLLPKGLSKSAISSSVLGRRRRYGYFFLLEGRLFASLNSVNCFNKFLSFPSFFCFMRRRKKKRPSCVWNEILVQGEGQF